MNGDAKSFYDEMSDKLKTGEYEWVEIEKSEFGESYRVLVKEFMKNGFKIDFNDDSTSARISF